MAMIFSLNQSFKQEGEEREREKGEGRGGEEEEEFTTIK
jgi:hypothetical protein